MIFVKTSYIYIPYNLKKKGPRERGKGKGAKVRLYERKWYGATKGPENGR